MNAKKPAPGRGVKSDLDRVDAYKLKAGDYAELPELTDDMVKTGVLKRGGQPVTTTPGRSAGRRA